MRLAYLESSPAFNGIYESILYVDRQPMQGYECNGKQYIAIDNPPNISESLSKQSIGVKVPLPTEYVYAKDLTGVVVKVQPTPQKQMRVINRA